MSVWPRGVLSGLATAGVVLVPRLGHAQTTPARPAPRETVVVGVHGAKAGMIYAFIPEEDPDEVPLAECNGDCRVDLPPGSYRLRVSGSRGSGIRTNGRTLTLSSDTDLHVDPATELGFAAGVATIATGATAATIGMLLLGLWGQRQECQDVGYAMQCHQLPLSTGEKWALGALGVGAAATIPIGIVIVNRNARPAVDVAPPLHGARNAGTTQIGLSLFPAGYGAAVSCAF
jgi:hypothetical protein